MLSFSNFLIEASESSQNTSMGAAYETATGLALHKMSGSINNNDPEHQKRISEMQKLHNESMEKLTPEKRNQVLDHANKSATSYLNSLKTNHGINPEDINEVHHTYAGIDNLLGRKVDRASNPHDIAIKTKDGQLHGASLKFKPGTLSNSTTNSYDNMANKYGINLNVSKVWNDAKEKAGLSGLSGKEVKSRRDEPEIKKANNEAQSLAAQHHSETFNNTEHEKNKKFLQDIMKSNPDLDYDYVVGSKGTSEPVSSKAHYQLLNNSKSLRAEHTLGGVVKIYDQDNNHLISFEHRPTHGAFSSIQVNGKLGTLKKQENKPKQTNSLNQRPLEVNTNRIEEKIFANFKSYILVEEAIRKGISHPKDLKYNHVKNILGDGSISGHLTEKSDGMAFAVGHDENGFYTRTSRSDKMRNPGDYEAAARAKFGEDFDPSISQHFDRIHRELQGNKNLTSYLQNHHKEHGDTLIKGEMFYKPHGTPAEDGGIRFVGTSYDPKKMGSTGSFVLHSRLPENEKHFPEVIKQLGDDKINFDHDIVPDSRVDVDAKDLKQKFDEINPDVLASRKKADADDKAIHKQKLDDINSEIEKRIRSKSDTIKPKWGNETEGHVFHPDTEGGPLVKVTSPTFQAFKASKAKPGNF